MSNEKIVDSPVPDAILNATGGRSNFKGKRAFIVPVMMIIVTTLSVLAIPLLHLPYTVKSLDPIMLIVGMIGMFGGTLLGSTAYRLNSTNEAQIPKGVIRLYMLCVGLNSIYFLVIDEMVRRKLSFYFW